MTSFFALLFALIFGSATFQNVSTTSDRTQTPEVETTYSKSDGIGMGGTGGGMTDPTRP